MYSSFLQNTEDVGQTYGGIAYDKLQLIRVQHGLEGIKADGENVFLSRAASGRAENMNTFHFTLNAICRNHTYGTQFDEAEYAIIASLDETCRVGGNTPSNILPSDTYFHADDAGQMRIPRAVVIAPEGAPVPSGLEPYIRTYARGDSPRETMENRDQAIRAAMQDIGAPLRDVSNRTWLRADGGELYPDRKSIEAMQSYFSTHGAKVTSDLHMDAPDGMWAQMLEGFQYDLADYKSGVRTRLDRYDRTEMLEDVMQQRLQEMQRFMQERLEEKAPENAIGFYAKSMDKAAQDWNRAKEPAPVSRVSLSAFQR